MIYINRKMINKTDITTSYVSLAIMYLKKIKYHVIVILSNEAN